MAEIGADAPSTKKDRVEPHEASGESVAEAGPVVRLRRRGGQVVQDADVYIGRQMTMGGWRLPASPWANPFVAARCPGAGKTEKAEEACRLYEDWIRGQPALLARLPELRGKTLGCWCKPGPCHGDVLVRLCRELGPAQGGPREADREDGPEKGPGSAPSPPG